MRKFKQVAPLVSIEDRTAYQFANKANRKGFNRVREIACIELVKLNKKRVRVEDIRKVAKKYELKYSELAEAFENYMAIGRVDLFKWSDSVETTETSKQLKSKQINKGKFGAADKQIKSTKYGAREARIAIELFTQFESNNKAFIEGNNIGRKQWFNWSREITLYGTLLGKQFFDIKKYGKIEFTYLMKLLRIRSTALNTYLGVYTGEIKNGTPAPKWIVDLLNNKDLFRYVQVANSIGFKFRDKLTEEMINNYYSLATN